MWWGEGGSAGHEENSAAGERKWREGRWRVGIGRGREEGDREEEGEGEGEERGREEEGEGGWDTKLPHDEVGS